LVILRLSPKPPSGGFLLPVADQYASGERTLNPAG
jgi:hypothetical protein